MDLRRRRCRRPCRCASRGGVAYQLNIRAEEAGDADNIASVEKHMADLMRVPTLVAGAVMPDACPSGAAPGTIPVGGVVAAKDAIHPGMHSADICCSMAVTVLGEGIDPSAVLDAGMKLSHFGGGGRPRGAQLRPPAEVLAGVRGEQLSQAAHASAAIEHFATQGDGNHFFYVGRVASSGAIALVTHHGSRKPGAMLYKAGMETAEKSDASSRPRRRGTTRGSPPRRAKAGPTGTRCRRSAPGPRPTTSPSTT